MMKKNKRKILLICLLVNLIILSSCTGGRQINELALVTAIGIDKEDDKIVLTCEVSNPLYSTEGDGSSSTSFSVIFVQGTGSTLFEAIRNTYLSFDRKLFLSHAKVLIIGEELAKAGITQHLDYILRAQEPREDIKILVSKGSKAYEVMGIKSDLSGSGGNYINDMLEKFSLNGKTINISLAEYYRYYYNENNEPVIGVIEREEKKPMLEDVKSSGPIETKLNIGGGAVTKRDSLIGYFTEDEMFGFSFIVDDLERGIVVFTTPDKLNKDISVIGNEGRYTSIEILKSKTKNDIKIEDDNIHLDLNIKLRGALIEESKAADLADVEIIEILEDSCSKEVEKIVSKTLEKGQKEFKQDNFSIGESVHQKYPELWKEIGKDWDEIFTEITYSVNVETEIVKMGNINVPANLRKGR